MAKLGKILKIVLVISILSVLALLAVNMMKQDHKELEELVKTDAFNEAYLVSSDVRTHAPGGNNGFSENGGLYSYSLYYIESAGYLQITVRYNEKHMADVKENYPTFDVDTIRYTLSDQNGTVYDATVVKTASKYHYEYLKLEFTGVDFGENTLKLNMVIDVLSDVIGEKNSVVLHKPDQESIPAQ